MNKYKRETHILWALARTLEHAASPAPAAVTLRSIFEWHTAHDRNHTSYEYACGKDAAKVKSSYTQTLSNPQVDTLRSIPYH